MGRRLLIVAVLAVVGGLGVLSSRQPEPPTPMGLISQPVNPFPEPAKPQQQAKPEKKDDKTAAKVMSAAAIALLIVEQSRRAYYATGHPCACPDDKMRNGRSCGGRSAYSRPGGAAPLCYVHDVTPTHIERYRMSIR